MKPGIQPMKRPRAGARSRVRAMMASARRSGPPRRQSGEPASSCQHRPAPAGSLASWSGRLCPGDANEPGKAVFTAAQIFAMIKGRGSIFARKGMARAAVCAGHGFGPATVFKPKAGAGGMGRSMSGIGPAGDNGQRPSGKRPRPGRCKITIRAATRQNTRRALSPESARPARHRRTGKAHRGSSRRAAPRGRPGPAHRPRPEARRRGSRRSSGRR